jgi:transposase
MGKLQKRGSGENIYYVYQQTYRVKIDPDNTGKKTGLGKSKVCTNAIYLGSAEKILQAIKAKREPLKVVTRNFGLIAAALQAAASLNLPHILQNNIPGSRAGVARWIYFFVTILNRLDHATSKNKMSQWLEKTILPKLLNFDQHKLTSKNFWYATDDVISEKELVERRKKQDLDDDLFAGLQEDVFAKIEQELYQSLSKLMGLSAETIFYDTTNFFTYLDQARPSELAQTCHSKDSKHHLRQVGLLMAVEKTYGVPLFSRVYQANRHDSKVFSQALSEMIIALKNLCGADSHLVLVLDKGNNSYKNFKAMHGRISWVGALVPSHHEDLLGIGLPEYHGLWRGFPYYRCTREVAGLECVVVMIYNAASARRQEHSLQNGIEKLKSRLLEKWRGYQKRPGCVPQGLKTILEKSDYGKCVKVLIQAGELCFADDDDAKNIRRKKFGKNLIFSDLVNADSGYLIDAYRDKALIEDDFKLLKDVTIIRFRPIRHWTDTKIRAYAFCCVVSMTLMRYMQWKADAAGYKMSPNVLQEELSDLQEVVVVYSEGEAERRITERSSVQEKLWEIFKLGEIEGKLLLH